MIIIYSRRTVARGSLKILPWASWLDIHPSSWSTGISATPSPVDRSLHSRSLDSISYIFSAYSGYGLFYKVRMPLVLLNAQIVSAEDKISINTR